MADYIHTDPHERVQVTFPAQDGVAGRDATLVLEGEVESGGHRCSACDLPYVTIKVPLCQTPEIVPPPIRTQAEADLFWEHAKRGLAAVGLPVPEEPGEKK